ncbi:DUF6893 family small protein [Nocardia rhizosphaerihabitans]|uniref:Uncharacterized protein n=1 Tax=Nocardia rhizosphaerihabitans TaxID=1691570 RepID=A0ABQ2KGQ3_9NOCA|nr:hypothetical protein GCM10011610_34960 [Nocardia rhizosphaerihabitans]
MAIIGMIAVGLAAVVAAGAAVLGVRSIPDMQRYLKIRRM